MSIYDIEADQRYDNPAGGLLVPSGDGFVVTEGFYSETFALDLTQPSLLRRLFQPESNLSYIPATSADAPLLADMGRSLVVVGEDGSVTRLGSSTLGILDWHGFGPDYITYSKRNRFWVQTYEERAEPTEVELAWAEYSTLPEAIDVDGGLGIVKLVDDDLTQMRYAAFSIPSGDLLGEYTSIYRITHPIIPAQRR